MNPTFSHITTVLMDVEGTTTRVQFVYEQLFPYAKAQLSAYLAQHPTDAQLLDLLKAVSIENPSQPAEHTLLEWMSKDIKHPLLKTLQGWLWQAGYEQGTLQGHVYEDVSTAFRQWRQAGLSLAIYSSGSVLAQQLLFAHSTAGNLRPYLCHHFDTSSGPKQQAASYTAIAQQLNCPPQHILFLSDIPQELDAALQAGMAVCQLHRPDHPHFEAGKGWPIVDNFDSITIQTG